RPLALFLVRRRARCGTSYAELPKNAIDFIVAEVSEREGSVLFRVPFIAPPPKKLKVDNFLPMPSDGPPHV
ncbi:TPA: hypothetical protein N0F65_007883, partial [Lagenidium giganteum]